MVVIATFPPNWTLIDLAVSEKSSFKDDNDKNDDNNDGRPCHGISSADTVKLS